MTNHYDPMASLRRMVFHEGEDEIDVFVCYSGYLDDYYHIRTL